MQIQRFWHSLMRVSVLALVLATGLSMLPATAQQRPVPLGQQGNRDQLDLPPTGMNSDHVRQRWGTPDSSRGPVGQPSISQWHYPAFVVYFESNRVIHAVIKHTPTKTP